MRIVLARSAAEMEALKSRWDSLCSLACAGGRATLFQRFSFNHLAARVFADREQPFVVCAENTSGSAIIPAALAREGTLVTFLGEALFDYRDVLLAGEGDALAAAWREVARLRQQLWVSGIRGEPRDAWQSFHPSRFSEAPGVAHLDAAQFAGSHPRAARLLRRLERKGVEVRQHPASDSRTVRYLYESKARQLADENNNLFADQRRIEFMVAAAEMQPLTTEVFTLESGGGMIAGLVTLRDGDVRRFYTVYFDAAWAPWSPGTALVFEVTRRALAEGLRCDYMTGSQSHKHRFANLSVPLLRVDASPGALASIVSGMETSPALAA